MIGIEGEKWSLIIHAKPELGFDFGKHSIDRRLEFQGADHALKHRDVANDDRVRFSTAAQHR